VLNRFVYSISNLEVHPDINLEIERLLACPYIPDRDKKVLEYTKTVAETGNAYPSVEYYKQEMYEDLGYVTSLQEIKALANTVLESYRYGYFHAKLIDVANSGSSTAEGIASLSSLVSEISVARDDLSSFSPALPEFSDVKANEHSVMFGFPEIDGITGGVQPGNVATIAAFTGGGKSTTCISIAYNSMARGKKGVYLTLEMTPYLTSQQMFCRYVAENFKTKIHFSRLVRNEFSKEIKDRLPEFREAYNKWAEEHWLVLDETCLDKSTISNYTLLQRLYKQCEDRLGGLDFVVVDHINQIELLYENMGNVAVRTLTSAGKTYHNQNGLALVTLLCAQVNREGYTRATKNGGRYSLSALAGLNEIERSSSYVLFLHATDELRNLSQTSVTLEKNRISGRLVTEAESVNFEGEIFRVGKV